MTDKSIIDPDIIALLAANGLLSEDDPATFTSPVTVPAPTLNGHALRWGSNAEIADLTLTGTVDLGAGSLILSAATAAGEPLIYDQAGARLNGLTTTDLTVEGTAPAFRSDNTLSPLADTAAQFYVGSDGSVFIRRASSGGATAGRDTLFQATPLGTSTTTDQNVISFPGAVSVEVPDATASGQAIAYDQSGARLNGLTSTGDITLDSNPAEHRYIIWKQEGTNKYYMRLSSAASAPFAMWSYDMGNYMLYHDGADGTLNLSFNNSVLVPDAQFDGEPIAWGQLNSELYQLELTNGNYPSLTIDSGIQSGIYMQSGGVNQFLMVTTAPSGSTPGILSLSARNPETGDFSHHAIYIDSDRKMNLASNDAVLVPDATSDGEALAYGQDNAVLGSTEIQPSSTYPGLTVKAATDSVASYIDLLSDTTGRIYFRSFDGTTQDWIVQGSAGNLSFIRGAYLATPLAITNADVVNMTGASSVTVPAPADGATTAAAQITAKDDVTGQLQLGGYEVGDTGVRDISSELETGWYVDSLTYPGYAHIRRVGYTVFLTMRLRCDGGGVIPWKGISGWNHPGAYGSIGQYFDQSNLTTAVATSAGGVLYTVGGDVRLGSGYEDPGFITYEVTYLTEDAWPSSLPGTAA